MDKNPSNSHSKTLKTEKQIEPDVYQIRLFLRDIQRYRLRNALNYSITSDFYHKVFFGPLHSELDTLIAPTFNQHNIDWVPNHGAPGAREVEDIMRQEMVRAFNPVEDIIHQE